jgi:CheY-like chemotaxis protein
MKDIMLFTYTNSMMREKLAGAGFSVIELKQSISEHYLASLFAEKKHIDCLAVVELIDENIERISGLIELLLEHSVEIVLITVRVSEGIKDLSLRYGIPDILEHSDPQRLLDYLLVIGESPESVGKIIIMDDDKPQVSILSAIIKRFNYRPIFVNSQNELFESLNQSNIQLVLLNLGTVEFDISSFVKRSFSHSEIKKLPCIAYKDIEKGLLVNEVVSGLNRLTRMILTPEELFSFLVNLFLRRELSHKIERLDTAVHMDTIGSYLKGSLSQTIKTAGEEIYSMKNIIRGDSYNKLFSISDSLKKTFTKVEGLKWMIKEDFDRPTCGLGV